jgi:ATP-binding cassette subfamily B protein
MFKLLKCAKKYIVPTILSPVLVIGEVVRELLIPLVMADIVNLVQAGVTDDSMNAILRLGLKMLLLAIGSLFCSTMAARMAAIAGMGFCATLREKMIGKIQTYSFSNIDHLSTASLITRLTTDVNNVQNTFVMMIRMLFRAPVMFVVALVITITKSRQVAMPFTVSLPLIALILIMVFSYNISWLNFEV